MAVGDDLADGAEGLPIVRDDEKMCFPWFRVGMNSEAVDAWSCFFRTLLEASQKQSRVTFKERPLEPDASPRFLMRCFLLKLGFIGDETKTVRRIILEGMPGNGSCKTPKAVTRIGE